MYTAPDSRHSWCHNSAGRWCKFTVPRNNRTGASSGRAWTSRGCGPTLVQQVVNSQSHIQFRYESN